MKRKKTKPLKKLATRKAARPKARAYRGGSVIGAIPSYADSSGAAALKSFIASDPKIYLDFRQPVTRQLQARFANGTFSEKFAAEKFLPVVIISERNYNNRKQRGQKSIRLNMLDKRLLAQELARDLQKFLIAGNRI